MPRKKVVIVGAGMAGLTAALLLSSDDVDVSVFERLSAPGGKLRETRVGNHTIDSGPTVLTMLKVFEEVFARAGATFADHVSVKPLDILARHAWGSGKQLDLFADIERSSDAIGAVFGKKNARGFLDFCKRARKIYETLEHPFLRSQRPNVFKLSNDVGLGRIGDLVGISPFTTLWRGLAKHFDDPRLLQLFGRYATYCGSSPYQSPATLMLVAHVEQDGVWIVEGGMQRLAEAMETLAKDRGAVFKYDQHVSDIIAKNGRTQGIRLASSEQIDADAVIVNADVSAIAQGLLGEETRSAVEPIHPRDRSLSAVTWSIVGRTTGFPLVRHNVFFSEDYQQEFRDILQRRKLPGSPTVYVCAQDRNGRDTESHEGADRLLCIVNAPADGDTCPPTELEVERCRMSMISRLAQCGLQIDSPSGDTIVTTPADFNRMFPGTGGAIYGRASHGWTASFRRPGSKTGISGLYLAGGSVHPGPGLPMAALSGTLAANQLIRDLDSTGASRATAMSGGTLTH